VVKKFCKVQNFSQCEYATEFKMSEDEFIEEYIVEESEDRSEESVSSVETLAEQVISDDNIRLNGADNEPDAGEQDDDYDDDSECDAIPWHHMQLYRLYGDEADYFLHPKLVDDSRITTTGTLKLTSSYCGSRSVQNIGRTPTSLIVTSDLT